MELTYTNANWEEKGCLKIDNADFAIGDENDFRLTVAKTVSLEYKSLVYVEGTEYGGMLTKIKASTGSDFCTWIGDTWHGLLASRIICPPVGSDYLTVDGEANAVLQYMIGWLGLSDLFTVSGAHSDIYINEYQFERYVDAYTGLCNMLLSAAGRISITFDDKVVLAAIPVKDYSDDGVDSEHADIKVTKDYRPYNHMIAMGDGELKDRVRVDLYADTSGNVSQTQTVFGIDERVYFYDYSSADRGKLIEDGTKKMEELQNPIQCEIDLVDDELFAIGDIVGGRESMTGVAVSAAVSKKILRINQDHPNGDIECDVGKIVTIQKEAERASSTVSVVVPTASESVKGGVKIGGNLKVTDEILSVDVIPTADIEAL